MSELIMKTFLGNAQRFQKTNDLAALDQAIAAGRTVVGAATDVDDWRRYITVLAQSLLAKYNAQNDRAALAECVQAFRAVAHNLPAGHRLRPAVFTGLGEALREVAKTERRADAADEAIYWFQMCAAQPSNLRGKAFFGVSTCLHMKANWTGDLNLLRDSVQNARHAVACAVDDGQRALHLIYLAAALALLHRRTEQPEVIREGVEAARAAIRLSPDEQQRRTWEKTLMQLQAQAALGGWYE
ncbi:hypothetical protein [Actinoplanes sp. NPDC048796]|uniref:hypothetical protein n=1 Tax=Actinoplanes sp. NPDC048796 TaxID=3155640 RepID=UPI0033FC9635